MQGKLQQIDQESSEQCHKRLRNYRVGSVSSVFTARRMPLKRGFSCDWHPVGFDTDVHLQVLRPGRVGVGG